jgi:ribonuclease HI
MSGSWRMHFDGGSRGNPGPAAWGWVLYDPDGEEIARDCGHIGTATNNVAEYTGLVRGVQAAVDHGARALDVRGDSELAIKQLRGEYRVKNATLRPLWQEATSLLGGLEGWTAEHVYRADNAVADGLVNDALDNLTR